MDIAARANELEKFNHFDSSSRTKMKDIFPVDDIMTFTELELVVLIEVTENCSGCRSLTNTSKSFI